MRLELVLREIDKNTKHYFKIDKPLILLVDDNAKNLQMLGTILEGTYQTAIALNGAEAVRCVASSRPDLILLDILMPEMSGFEVFEQLQRAPDTRNIPIIFLTARDEPENVVKGLQMGPPITLSNRFSKPNYAPVCRRIWR